MPLAASYTVRGFLDLEVCRVSSADTGGDTCACCSTTGDCGGNSPNCSRLGPGVVITSSPDECGVAGVAKLFLTFGGGV